MILTTMEQAEYDLLIDIQKRYPKLTYQHEPYQEWVPQHFTEEDKKALIEVKNMLKKAITGIRNFTNFYFDKKGELNLRFYYDWSWTLINDIPVQQGLPFTGVGYLKVIELLNGFDKS